MSAKSSILASIRIDLRPGAAGLRPSCGDRLSENASLIARACGVFGCEIIVKREWLNLAVEPVK
jgi:hypothetical protein